MHLLFSQRRTPFTGKWPVFFPEKSHCVFRLHRKKQFQRMQFLLSATSPKIAKQVFFILFRVLIVFIVTVLASGCSTLTKRAHYHPALGNRIVNIATQYEGTPYREGGTTPDGFDCSGFTFYVFKKAGITIPRTTGLQYGSGSRVAKSDLMKGDLIFFMRWPLAGMILPPNHVGIYVGDGQFIHASSKGATVRYDSLNNPYWKSRYKGARDLKSL